VLFPAQSIIHNEAIAGGTLLFAAVAAIAWANSPWSEGYRQFQHLPVTIQFGGLTIKEDLHHWVNDGLMAIFFFGVGLEIKRELLRGDLAERRKAAFPAIAALGGMVLPASLYAAFNVGGEGLRGWGIPMATDIAFALGVLALLGKRAPSQLRVLLLALAIVDDIGAILVIAVFYTATLSASAMAVAAAILGLIIVMLKSGFRNSFLYLVAGMLFWLAVFKSGVHATIAGVLLGVVAPCRRWFTRDRYIELASEQLAHLKQAWTDRDVEEVDRGLGGMEALTRETEAPLDRLLRMVHPWVSFAVLPLFAFINAGVTFSSDMVQEAVRSPVTLGVIVGLLIGKTVGIFGFAWTGVRFGIAKMPEGLTWSHIAGTAVLAGIGFTVALFISELAFHGTGPTDQANAGILVASLCAGLAGLGTLWWVGAAKR
jgi:NhaA family Na+:H+ antiporter